MKRVAALAILFFSLVWIGLKKEQHFRTMIQEDVKKTIQDGLVASKLSYMVITMLLLMFLGVLCLVILSDVLGMVKQKEEKNQQLIQFIKEDLQLLKKPIQIPIRKYKSTQRLKRKNERYLNRSKHDLGSRYDC